MNWTILAQAASTVPAAGQPNQPQSGGWEGLFSMMVMMGSVFAIFYFLMIRPQRKQEKQRQEMLKALQKNDKVVTMGGLYGVVTNVRDKDVTLKIDESKDVRVKVLRSAVSHVVTREEDSEQGAQA